MSAAFFCCQKCRDRAILQLPPCEARQKEGSDVRFTVDYAHGELRLTDLASTNGTFVNGQELVAKSIVLHKHDLITLGASTDLIVLPSHAAKHYFRR